MTATTHVRSTSGAGLAPSKGTYGVAANTLCLRGTIATVDSDGNTTPGTLNAGLNACGIYASTYDNRTTAPEGGGAAALDAEIEFGVKELLYTGTAPKPGQVVFVYDNQTVTLDSNNGARGIAGYCSEQHDTGKCWVLMGPTVVAQIVIAAAIAADVVTAGADIDALEVDAATPDAYVPIPLTSFLDADCDPLTKFTSEANPTFGFNLADSEAVCLRWNNHATPGTATAQVSLPFDLDDTKTATVEFLCSKSGATVGDATALTIGCYIISAGDLHNADINCGGDTGALVGDATANTTAVLSRTIAAADIPSGARSMTLTVTPKAGTLGTDDLLVHSVRLHYTRKVYTAP